MSFHPANFELRPFHSRVRSRRVTDKQTDTGHHFIMPPPNGGRGNNNLTLSIAKLSTTALSFGARAKYQSVRDWMVGALTQGTLDSRCSWDWRRPWLVVRATHDSCPLSLHTLTLSYRVLHGLRVYGWLRRRQRPHTSRWPDNCARLKKGIAPDSHVLHLYVIRCTAVKLNFVYFRKIYYIALRNNIPVRLWTARSVVFIFIVSYQ